MATIDWNQADGIQYHEDPSTGAQYYTIVAMVKDLAQGDTMDLIVEALALMPDVGSAGPVPGTVVYTRNPQALPPCDAIITISYGPPIAGSLFGPPKLRVSTSADMSDTEFDYANRNKPLIQRVPISVAYDANQPNAAPGANKVEQGGRVPFYAGKSTATYTITLPYNPSDLSIQYSCMTNSVAWKGHPPGAWLCMCIEGESSDGEITFQTDFTFLLDVLDGFMQYLRWVDPLTGRYPTLTVGQVSGRNGITDVKVQGEADFTNLPV